jgi:polar amino acid transport system substrate-binding protein
MLIERSLLMNGIYVLLLLLFIHASSVAEDFEHVVLYTEQFPPYNYADNGKLKGINFELVELMCDRAKINCTFELLPWNRAYNLAKTTPNAGVFSTSRNERREPDFLWVGPLVSSKAYFYKLKSRPEIKVVDSSDILKYTVAATHNDIYENILMEMGFIPNKNLLGVSGESDSTKLFFAGKLDLLVASPNTLLHKVGSRRDMVEPLIPLNIDSLKGNHIAFNLQTRPEVVEKLKRALVEIWQEKLHHELINKYAL